MDDEAKSRLYRWIAVAAVLALPVFFWLMFNSNQRAPSIAPSGGSAVQVVEAGQSITAPGASALSDRDRLRYARAQMNEGIETESLYKLDEALREVLTVEATSSRKKEIADLKSEILKARGAVEKRVKSAPEAVREASRTGIHEEPKEPLAKEWAVHPPGYDGIIEEGQDHYAAPTKTDWDELFKTVRADDSQGLLELVMAERAFLLSGGTKVKILDSPFGAQQYEVRVLSGKRSGQRAFVLKKAVW